MVEAWRGAVADIRRARSSLGRERLGAFGIEGTRAHERAIRAGADILLVVVGEGWAAETDPRRTVLLAELADRTTVHRVPDAVLLELTEGRSIGALVGLVRRGPSPGLNEVVSAKGRPALLLVAADVEDPGNVGALVRTALASGCAGMIASGIADPYHPKAVRTSMGSVFRIPLLTRPSTTEVVAELRMAGVRTLAAVASGGRLLPDVGRGTEATAVLVGGEAFGLDRDVLKEVDDQVTVPMAEQVDSLSVNAAAAIVLYELRRSATV